MLSESQFDILDSLDLYSNNNEKPFGHCPGCKKTCYALAWCDACDRKALATWNDGIRIVKKVDGTWIKTRSEPCAILLKEIKESGNIDQDYINENNDIWFKTRSKPYVVSLKEIKESENIDQDYINKVLSFICNLKAEFDFYNIDENYPNFGTCPRCENEFNAPAWCDTCDRKELNDKFNTWTTGNDNINLLIRESQSSAPDYYNYLEFIHYDRFKDIEKIAEGGFGVVFKATWLDGIRIAKKQDDGIWIKTRSEPCTVALKEINRSEHVDQEYLNEVQYRVSQELFVQGKDRLKWQKKLQYLYFICNGIRGIHQLNYVHGDIHCGNILLKYTSDICITDLGLSRPANSKEASQNKSSDDPPAGNIPYLAPELLKKYPKSKASDIYAIGILMTEFASHDRAFENYNSTDLKIDIYRGERPKFPPETPNCYVELMKECLDDDPNKRPTAEKLVKSISGWLKSDWKSKSNPFNIADKQWSRNVSKG
ncbi:5097_t:CDS:2 [Funneliformis mosseae]|uniref:5097_t:CDS:1 n=1 Tax=Funneliformis mosseae TaxID=27381 RepID=A0A9N8Z4N4_FUNMO|nr:5097_t:CDS:2 [Funneliformis mosseae]